MASGIFSILDDVAALMDDVAVASKVATQKTAGILGDDLAVNAEKATGFLSSRELPVLWRISKGSLLNKLIIVPVALLLSTFFPIAITVALVLGGLFLAYEAVEKIIEFLFHRAKKGHEVIEHHEGNDPEAEKIKIKSAITTDFILSVEIVIIALGSVIDKSLPIQIITVVIVSLLATIGVYGFVAIVVRMDDVGFKLIKHSHDKGLLSMLGHGLVKLLPLIIKFFGIVGTIALILVSGGIFVHNIAFLHSVLPEVPLVIKEALMGLAAGLAAVAVATGAKKLISLVRRGH
jgi:predicted DNA repair protein MutK